MNTIFHDHRGQPVYVLGLQAHNSSNGNETLLARSIQAVQRYHGNTLEVPVYWASIETAEGCFDFSMVDDLLVQVRQADLHLILLWFGFSKNCDANIPRKTNLMTALPVIRFSHGRKNHFCSLYQCDRFFVPIQ